MAEVIVEDKMTYYENLFLKPVVSAAIGAAATKMTVFNSDSRLLIGGMEIPLLPALFGGFYAAGLVGEFLSYYVFPNVGRAEKFSNGFFGGLIQPAIVGGANVAVMSLAATEKAIADRGILYLFAIGAISEIAGDYVWDHFVVPFINS